MKRTWFKWIVIGMVCAAVFASLGSTQAQTPLWQDVTNPAVRAGQRQIVPTVYRTLALDFAQMRSELATAPREQLGQRQAEFALSLPLPDGTFGRFYVTESPIMEPDLAAKFPNIKTYVGEGIDDPTATVRLDMTPTGFHAAIFSAEKTIYIDPFSTADTTHYISYDSAEMVAPEPFIEHGVVQWPDFDKTYGDRAARPPVGPTMRQYRLAVAATGEYTAYHGGTVALGQAAIVTAINRVNGIYEREVAIRMVLVANNDQLVYTNAATDPYSNNNPNALLSENQANIDSVIGSANYDVGHVFTTGGGGLAGLGVVCNNSRKAQGETGRGAPINDPFYVDYVAHELGHQFDGAHTFNGNASNCAGNGSAASAYEPGSGSTIQAYAGICGAQNLQNNSDDYFHTESFDQMVAYTRSGTGASCGVDLATGNSAPVPEAGTGGFTIPIRTPFELTGSATDPDNDSLTYNWEAYDLGSAGAPSGTSAPYFRSWPASTSPTRTFPRLADLLQNTTVYGEDLPAVSDTLNFRLTARDNRAGGGVAYDTITFDVSNEAGPFLVTAPNNGVTWAANDAHTVTWDVARTDQAPVSCAAVDILLSTDGGNTFPTTLIANVENDGSQAIVLPNTPTTTARIKVKCSDNIFFDLSNVNFTIDPPADGFAVTVEDDSAEMCAGASATYAVDVSRIGSFLDTVTLSAPAAPVSTTFSNNSTVPPFTSTLTLASVPAGSYSFDLVGNAGGDNRAVPLTLLVDGPLGVLNTTAPANGAVDVQTRPTLSWTDLGAHTYTVTVATTAAFTDTAVVLTTTGLSATLTERLQVGQQYFWRVEASNLCGVVSSEVASFTTADGSLFCGASESFEGGIPDDWTVITVSGTGWDTTSGSACGSGSADLTVGANYAGTGDGACADSDAYGSNGIMETYLCTPALDLTGVISAELGFKVNYQIYNATDPNDIFSVLPSTAAASGPYEPALFNLSGDYPNSSAFGVVNSGSAEVVDLVDYLGNEAAYICFQYKGDYDWYAHLDDVSLTCTDAPALPTAVQLQPAAPSDTPTAARTLIVVLTGLLSISLAASAWRAAQTRTD